MERKRADARATAKRHRAKLTREEKDAINAQIRERRATDPVFAQKMRDRANRRDRSEEKAAYGKAYREANREKMRARQEAWRAANVEHVAEKKRQFARQAAEELRLAYVAQKLRMPVADVTPELLEKKREQLAITRALRETKR
jgi:hypothetical protein